MSRQIVAVIGAHGFVGSAVVRLLAHSDWATPVAIVRHERSVGSPVIARRIADATNPQALVAALAGVDAAVNCVLGDAATIAASGRALFDHVDRTGLRCIHLGTMAVYGTAVGDVDEDATLTGVLGAYAEAKLELERRLAGHANVTVLRPGIIYGPGGKQWSEQIGRWLLARRLGSLGPAGEGFCNLVHVDDVAQAIESALRCPSSGQAYNLAMNDPPTWNAYFERFANRLGMAAPARISASRLAFETRAMALPLKILGKVTTSLGVPAEKIPRPITSALVGLWSQKIRLVVHKAERELGFRARSLDAGLADTAATISGKSAA